ncbi:hypothetical protein AAKU67_002407 [Oxalobacteraceae bacterium GrIS 2.11]
MLNKLWKYADIVSVLVLVLLFANGLAIILGYPAMYWVDFIYDDSYYYLGLARNLSQGLGSQYMPPFHTNGYQPIWLMILSASAWLSGISPASQVAQVYCLTFGCALAFAWLSKKKYGCCFPAVLVIFCYPYVSLDGMESSLMPILVIGYFTANNWISKAVIGVALFLTRIDSLAFIVASDVYQYFKNRNGLRFLKHYLIIGSVVIAYLVINFVYFGVPVPISGLSKAVGNVRGENYLIPLTYLERLKRPLYLALILLVIHAGFRLKAIRYGKEVTTLFCTIWIYAAYYALNSGWPVWGWYFWPIMMLAYYLLLEIVHQLNASLTDRETTLKKVICLGLVVLIMGKSMVQVAGNFVLEQAKVMLAAYSRKPVEETFGTKNVELAEYIHTSKIPAGSMFAMGDRAGSFGFFLGNAYQFFHTEGLVNNVAYYQAMSADRGLPYFETFPVNYFIADSGHYFEEADIIGVIEPGQGMSSHVGPWLICFRRAGIVMDQSYGTEKRYMFNTASKVVCPAPFQQDFLKMRSTYGAVRRFSHPSEYVAGRGGPARIP